MESAKRVLIVAHRFLPAGGSEMLRAVAFAKYLVEFGWSPIILTADHLLSIRSNAELLDELPDSVTIVRVKNWLRTSSVRDVPSNAMQDDSAGTLDFADTFSARIRRLFQRWRRAWLSPNEPLLWAIHSVLVARRLVREEKISCVFTTACQVSHLVGLFLKRSRHVAWVADFHQSVEQDTCAHQMQSSPRLELWIEEQVRTHADHITTITEEQANECLKKVKAQSGPITVIPNGADKADFPITMPTTKSGLFTMVYAGRLSKQRSLEFFLKALSHALRSGRIRSEDIRIHFANVEGPVPLAYQELVARLHLERIVTWFGPVSHREAMEHLSKAHALLFIGDGYKTSGLPVPETLYEYLYTRRPIVALSRRGAEANLIARHQAGIVVSPTDIVQLEDELVRLVKEFTVYGAPSLSLPLEIELTRPYQAEQLARILDQLNSPLDQTPVIHIQEHERQQGHADVM